MREAHKQENTTTNIKNELSCCILKLQLLSIRARIADECPLSRWVPQAATTMAITSFFAVTFVISKTSFLRDMIVIFVKLGFHKPTISCQIGCWFCVIPLETSRLTKNSGNIQAFALVPLMRITESSGGATARRSANVANQV